MTLRRCSKCNVKKPATAEFFYWHSKSKNRLRTFCKDCKKKIEEIYKFKNTEKIRNYYLNYNYGIDIEQYNYMLDRQKGKCEICGLEEKSSRFSRLSVDHCHRTGKVRALLCNTCNITLGKIKENIDTLYAMIGYLKKHE